MATSLDSNGILSILFFFSCILAVGIHASLKKNATAEAYFLGNRQTNWIVLGASLFSSELLLSFFFQKTLWFSSSLVVSSALSLLSFGLFFLVVWSLIPRYVQGRASTVISLIEKRSGRSVGILIAISLLILYVGIGLEVVSLFSDVFFREYLGWEIRGFGIVIIVLIGLVTIMGGYTAVLRIQALLALFIFASTFFLVSNGVSPIQLGHVFGEQRESLSIAAWVGYLISAIWFWGFDQYYVQHLLSAPDVGSMKLGAILAAFLKIFFLATILGAGIGMTNATFSSSPSVAETAPALCILSISIAVSMLVGLFAGSASIFSIDIYEKLFPSMMGRKLVLVGRLATTGIVIVAICSVLVTRILPVNAFQYFHILGILIIASCSAAAMKAVLLPGIFPEGGVLSIVAGFLAGVVWLIVQVAGAGGDGITAVSIHELACWCFLTGIFILLVNNSRQLVIRYHERFSQR